MLKPRPMMKLTAKSASPPDVFGFAPNGVRFARRQRHDETHAATASDWRTGERPKRRASAPCAKASTVI